MRHRVKKISLGKDRKHRISILRNLATALIRNERITTTQAKARIFRPFIEKIITRAKVDNLHNRRLVFEDIKSTTVLKKLFENVAKRYLSRPGGYTRTYKLIQRTGDASEMCIIELVPEFLNDAQGEKEEKPSKTKEKTLPKKEKSDGKNIPLSQVSEKDKVEK